MATPMKDRRDEQLEQVAGADREPILARREKQPAQGDDDRPPERDHEDRHAVADAAGLDFAERGRQRRGRADHGPDIECRREPA